MAGIEIRGLAGEIEKLRSLGKNLDTIVDGALEKSAKQIEAKASKNIETMNVSYNGRTYDALDTGRLQRSIKHEKIPNGYAIGTDVEYAPYVEFGTSTAGDPAVAHTAREKWPYFDDESGQYRTAYPLPPRPFLRPAFNDSVDLVKDNIVEAIKKAAEEG